MLNSRCCGQIVHVTQGMLAVNSNVSRVVTSLVSRFYSSKGKGGKCGENTPQTEGRTVEPWPKSDPPPQMWRSECPQDPQPPNYDPYRIKVPEVVVPPLPPSNARWSGVVFSTGNQQQQQGQCEQGQSQQEQQYQPYQWDPHGQEQDQEDKSFMGILKGFYDRLRGKGKGSKDTMMLDTRQLPMIDCAKKSPCSLKPVPDPPPCPPPPPKPFPWIYVWTTFAFYALMGLLYKVYLYKEECDKSGENKVIWTPRRKMKRPYYDKDMPACVQYLIVGTGAAGWAAYRSIKEHDKTAKVFFITSEDIIPYKRPPMSKTMWWNPDPPDIRRLTYLDYSEKRHSMLYAECLDFMDPVKFYRKKKGPALSIATGWCVSRVDADDHVVYVRTKCGEQPVYYERCLLALGAKAKTLSTFKSAPKKVRDRICHLRTIRDLEIAYRRVKESKSVVIIGGGTLGTELAYHLGRMNKKVERPEGTPPLEVVHIVKDKGLLSGFLPEYLGVWLAERVRCQGVTIIPQCQVYDMYNSKDGRLELTLSNGKTLVTDYAFVAIGANPREELAKPSFLELDHENGGFAVDTELRARTHLYVAGDAASVYMQLKDYRLRFEHYDNAVQQGNIAGANMTGYWTPCNMEPWFDLSLHDDLEMEVVGEVGGCMPTIGLFKECDIDKVYFTEDERTKSGDPNRKCYKEGGDYEARYKNGMLFYLRDEIVVGFIFWNIKPAIEDRMQVATELLRAKPSYKDIDQLAELLGFGSADCTYKVPADAPPPPQCIKRKEW